MIIGNRHGPGIRTAGITSFAALLFCMTPDCASALTGSGTQIDPYLITSSNWNLSGGYYWEATSNVSISSSLQLTNTTTSGESNTLYVRTSGVTLSASSVRICYTDNCYAYVYVSNGASFVTTTGSINVGFKGTGLLDLDNATATSGTSGLSIIGYNASSTGTVNVKNNSTFTTVGSLDLGYTATSTGTLNVTGSGSSASVGTTLSVGESGTGTINVTGGGALSTGSSAYVGMNAGASGTVLVSGGSHWQSAATTIGYSASSTGNVTITGDTSYMWDSGSLTVGSSGSGTLTIEDGALVAVAGTLSTGASGVIQMNGGLLAIKSGDLLSSATVASGYNIDVYNGSTYVAATGDNLNTVYYINLATWQSSSYYSKYNTLDLTGYTLVSVVPEPSAYALFGSLAAFGLAWCGRRRK
jgi:T5SS/PEP-CTERM-associated repeat protein